MVVASLPDRLKYIASTFGRPNACCAVVGKSRRKPDPKMEMAEFLFVPTQPSVCNKMGTGEVGSIVLSGVTSLGALALAVSGGGLATAGAAAACVAIVVPMSNSLIDAGVNIGDDAKKSMATLNMVNSLQLSAGLIEFLTGDIVNGFIHMLMAGVGFYVVQVDGIVLLPSYSVASTVFASVSLLNMIEMLVYKGTISGDLTLSTNFIKLATICHPIMYAASAYLAWKLIEQLRAGLLTSPGNDTANPALMLEPSFAPTREPFAGRGFHLDHPVDT